VYVSELDSELWADFRAAVCKKYGGLRKSRGRSYVTAAIEALLSQFIVQVNDSGLRARDIVVPKRDKFMELLMTVQKNGADRTQLCNYIRKIFDVRQERTIKNIGAQFLSKNGFSQELQQKWNGKGKFSIG